MFKHLTVVLPFLALFSISVQAQMACNDVHLPSLAPAETSVEMEVDLNEGTAKLITSTDGYLSTLFSDRRQIPKPILDYIAEQKGNLNSVWIFPVEQLPTKLKLLAFQQSIISRKLRFGDSAGGNRIIPGIKIKDQYRDTFELRSAIDLGSPRTVKDARLIEIHLRSKSPSGDLIDRANRVFAEIGSPPGSMHMHIVIPLINEWLKEQPKMNTFRLVEFWRRMNLVFEMRDVVENGNSIRTKEMDDTIAFSPLGYDDMKAAFNYFSMLTQTEMTEKGPAFSNLKKVSFIKREWLKLRSHAKMGWVGFWGHDKYDRPDLMGFEFRFLTGKDKDQGLRKFLSGFPSQMKEHRFGLSEEDIQKWYTTTIQLEADRQHNPTAGVAQMNHLLANPDNLPVDIFTHLNPHQSYEKLSENLPWDMKKILLGMDQKKVQEAFEDRGRIRYLLHNWSWDPLLIKHEELMEKVANAQLKALRRWARGESERQVTQEFLIESGLYFAFAESIGLEI